MDVNKPTPMPIIRKLYITEEKGGGEQVIYKESRVECLQTSKQ